MSLRTWRTVVVAVVMLSLGWVGGRAQQPESPDLVFNISTPATSGETIFECVQGCADGAPLGLRETVKLQFGCNKDLFQRCEATINGWVRGNRIVMVSVLPRSN